MNRDRGPGTELLGSETGGVTEWGEDVEGKSVEEEDGCERDAGLCGGGADDGTDGGDGRATADGGAAGNESGNGGVGLEELGEEMAGEEDERDGGSGEAETSESSAEHLVQIHGQTEDDDAGLNEVFTGGFAPSGDIDEASECEGDAQKEGGGWREGEDEDADDAKKGDDAAPIGMPRQRL